MYPVVYIAGEHSNDISTVLEEAGEIMGNLDALVVAPSFFLRSIAPENTFASMCCELVTRSDVVYILPGSEGDMDIALEVAAAEKAGILICYTIEELTEALDELYP